MRSVARAILAGGLGFAVSLLVSACGGGSGLLSGDQSSSISGQIDQISSALQAGDCTGVSKATVNLSRAVAELPASVNPGLRQNLDQGVSTVGQLANQDCRPATTSQTTTPSTSSTASTTTTSSTPTQTTTTSSPTTTTSTSTTPPATTTSTTGTSSTGSGGTGLGGGSGNSGSGGGASSGGGGAAASAPRPGGAGGASADNGNGR